MSAVLVFWKHRKKEKLLVTSNFSFSLSVFYLFGEFSVIFIKFKIVVCWPFEFGRVKNLSFGKRLREIRYESYRSIMHLLDPWYWASCYNYQNWSNRYIFSNNPLNHAADWSLVCGKLTIGKMLPPWSSCMPCTGWPGWIPFADALFVCMYGVLCCINNISVS